MKKISSTQNSEIKNLEKLKNPKGRDLENKFLAEGIRISATLVASGMDLLQVYVTQKMLGYALGFTKEEKVTIVSESVMKKISSSKSPSGLMCVFSIPEKRDSSLLNSGIVLAQISDPGNMGTLIRTAVAMNIKSIVIVEGVDPWSPKVVQSSAGTIAQANIFQWSWEQLIQNKKDLKLCALVVSEGNPPENINFKDILLVIGNEAHGIPKHWLSECEQKMTIPMPGNTESLNAAVAGSIAMYLAFSKKK